MFFTGNWQARAVLVHLNPKQRDNYADGYEGELGLRTAADYVDHHAHFGARVYGPAWPRSHRSGFDHKQIRVLRPFDVIEFLPETDREAVFTNLERVADHKLQLEVAARRCASGMSAAGAPGV
jgi:hypothetical protein